MAFLVRHKLCRPEIDGDCSGTALADRLDSDQGNLLTLGFVRVEAAIVLEKILAHYIKGQGIGHVIDSFAAQASDICVQALS